MSTEEFRDFLRKRIPELLKEHLGEDSEIEFELNIQSSDHKPVAVRDGFFGRTHWEIRLMADETPFNQVLVELPVCPHPRLFGLVPQMASRLNPIEWHICPHGPVEWHKTLHLCVPKSEPCEEIAEKLAKLIDRHRISRMYRGWLRFRAWLAKRLLPAGYTVTLERLDG